MTNVNSSVNYQVVDSNLVPLALLLEADPSQQSINSYLADAWCFAAYQQEAMVGICVVREIKPQVAEVFNVSVLPECQRQGIGSALLRFALGQLSEMNIRRVELGTGTFGYQLTYYQRLGFRVESIIKDHFLVNYSEPIFEHGIQHKDMLRLSLNLVGKSDAGAI